MIKPKHAAGWAVIFLLPLLLACSTPEIVSEETEREVRDTSHLEELYWSRLEESRQSFVQADVDFMADMIVHHAQALIMSRLAPDNGASRQVQTLAARIINAQQDEIDLMQQWLRDRGQDVPLVSFDGIVMHVTTESPESHDGHHDEDQHGRHHPEHHGHGEAHDMAHHHDMPGMLTQEQLEELEAARDEEFDHLFLAFMIEHHEGAVHMVYELFATDGAAVDREAYRLAVDIYAEQVTEISMMRQMLTERGHEIPPSILPVERDDHDSNDHHGHEQKPEHEDRHGRHHQHH